MNNSPREQILLSLGSNLGNRRAHMAAGIQALRNLPGIEILAVSRLHETEAWGGPEDQRSFLNAAVVILSSVLSPQELLAAILEIESNEGRVRKEVNGPRTLDIDILLWGERIVDEPELQIPHVGLHQRSFVLLPAAEVAQQMRHPRIKKTIHSLASNVGISGLIRVISEKGWFHALGQSTC